QQLLDRLRRADTEDSQSAGTSREVAVEIKSGIPAHQGLGAGSQLALALACGLDRLSGRRSSVQELSHRAGRGGRSAIGTWGFEHGGLLCDGGRADSGAADRLAPLVARVAVPEQWRFVLLLPTDSCGLSGPEEAAAFRQLKGVPDADTDRLCRIILMQLVPAFREAEFEEAATAIGEYGRVAGRYFSEIQCGLFTHPKLAALAASLAEYGGQGLAQTSWGPGCAVLCRNQTMAEKLSGLAVSQGAGWLTTQIVQGLNRGATIECH
ncbi:MAG: hypothetical protein VB858_19645, partial [Planctomycetaceae bacterium]